MVTADVPGSIGVSTARSAACLGGVGDRDRGHAHGLGDGGCLAQGLTGQLGELVGLGHGVVPRRLPGGGDQFVVVLDAEGEPIDNDIVATGHGRRVQDCAGAVEIPDLGSDRVAHPITDEPLLVARVVVFGIDRIVGGGDVLFGDAVRSQRIDERLGLLGRGRGRFVDRFTENRDTEADFHGVWRAGHLAHPRYRDARGCLFRCVHRDLLRGRPGCGAAGGEKDGQAAN